MRLRMAILLLPFLFLFQVALTSVDRRAVDLQREKSTLLALKQGLTLPMAAALADWNESNGDVCGFTGVRCDWRREHVVGLSLANIGISGAIPPVIGELAHLRILDVSNNSISGAVPKSVGKLIRLQSLFMNDNSISGTLIPIFSNLRRLRNLDVSYNSISGAIPLAVGSLGQLQSLNVSGNNISGTIPPSIGNLTRLEYLYMQDNFISGGIPLAFYNLTSLLELKVSANQLTGQIPAELSKLRKIQAIDLGINQLHGGIPASLSELTAMLYLALEQNNLSGTIPPAIFLNCTGLGFIDLSNNDLSGEIPGAISSYGCPLVSIHLYSNKLQGTLPQWIASCTDLMSLDVESNLLDDELPTSIISGKKSLMYLHLSNNRRFQSHDNNSNLEPFFVALSNCTNLQELEAGNVGMGGQLPSRLGSLLPSNNHISGEIPGAISSTQGCSFRVLSLYSNNLRGTLPRWLSNCTYLMFLDVENNLLDDELPTSIILGTPYLMYLHLSNNRFRSHDNNSNLQPFFVALSNCTSLQVVDAGAVGMGGQLPSSLLPSNNQLSGEIPRAISSTQGCSFFALNLYSNYLRGTLPRWLSNCTYLMFLDVENNLLDDELPTSIISGTPFLMYLHLSNNRFRSHDDNNLEPFFAALSNLTGLPSWVIWNLSTTLSSEHFLPSWLISELASLGVLRIVLSNNTLKGEIPPSIGNCTSLGELDLSGNMLSGSIPSSIESLVQLRVLSLRRNQLSGYIPQ